jgi:ethanolamine utilization protein EutN
MRLARIIGTVVSTVKNDTLTGKKILILKHLDSAKNPFGTAFLALDAIGAGIGEDVYYVRAKEASFPFLPAETPSDATIVGIVDRIYAADKS